MTRGFGWEERDRRLVDAPGHGRHQLFDASHDYSGSGLPMIFKTTVEEILSGARLGTKMVTPSFPVSAFNRWRRPSQFDFNK